jgi:streptogramin lyase
MSVASSQVNKPLAFEPILPGSAVSSLTVREICQDRDGFMWIGSTSGLYRYDGYQLTSFTHDPNDSLSISGNHILEIVQDSLGFVWIGTQQTGLNCFDPVRQTFSRYTFSFPSENDHVNSIWGIHADQNHIWAASRDGLVRMNRQTGIATRIQVVNSPQNPDQKRQNMLRQIRQDPDAPDVLWFSSLSGLYSLDTTTLQITTHWTEDFQVDYPLDDEYDGQYMYAHFVHTPHTWILGSYGGGHYHYSPSTSTWSASRFEPKNPRLPLSDNIVLQYIQVSDSTLFFTGSKTGLYNHQRKASEFVAFSDEAGPVQISGYTEGLVADRSGHIWIGTQKGIYRSVMPMTKSRRIRNTKMYFPEIQVDEAVSSPPVTTREQPMLLSAHHKRMRIEYAAVMPEGTDSVIYRYRIPGRHMDWQKATDQRIVQYEGWPAGPFEFQVQAMHSNTREVIADGSLWFNAEIFFWKRWWFLPLIFTVGICGVAAILFFRFRFAQSKARLTAEYERQLAQTEMAALRSQLNPHFLFNSLNSIKHYIITNEPRTATRYLNKFAALMRLALDNSRDSFITLKAEIEFISLFLELEQVRLGEKLSYRLVVDPGLDVNIHKIPPMLLQPFIENAIWHGILNKPSAGHLLIQIEPHGDKLKIRIEDDGIGRKASATIHPEHSTRKSLGLKLITDRLELLHKMYSAETSIHITDLTDEKGQASGTRVEIILPLQSKTNDTA